MDVFFKSPLNYVGGKYKLLPQIIKLFPKDINTFVDLFCGGCNVGINVEAKKIICNDIETSVIDLMNYFKSNTSESIIFEINSLIKEYNLSDTYKNGYEYYNCDSSSGVAKVNKEGYLKLRNDYNSGKNDPITFYTMLIFAFNNQIRFNSKGEFNMPVNKRDFNGNIQKNLVNFVDKMKIMNIVFTNNHFNDLKINNLKQNDFVYADPPYLITCASYNEQDGWNEQKEKELLHTLDCLNENNIKFALSNVLENKGNKNEILINWSEKYNVHYLNNSYGNSNYQSKDKSKGSTVEVLITNY